MVPAAGRALLGVVEWQYGVIREKNRLINLLCPEPDPDAGKDQAVENGPGTMDDRSGSGRQSQMTLLRLELVRANREIDAARASWAAEAGVLVAKERQLVERLDERDLTVSVLEADLKDARRQLAVHENYNNPSSKVTLCAKKRREYRRKSKAAREGATPEEVEEAGKSKGRRGKRAGADGTTPAYKPDKSKTVQFVQDMCGMWGRTDTVLMNYVWKIVVDIGECGKVVCYMEKIAPAYCGVCSVITWPATGSIPGTWAGPNLRRIIMNIHEVAYTVWAISRLLRSNHDCIMSAGAVSNCISAMAEHARNGSRVVRVAAPGANAQDGIRAEAPKGNDGSAEAPKGNDGSAEAPKGNDGSAEAPKGNDGSVKVQDAGALMEPLPSASKPPLRALHSRAEPHHSPESTPWPALQPPLLARLEDIASMAPYAMEDESEVNVAGKRSQALVLCVPGLVIIRIMPNRSKVVMKRVFWMVLNRPLATDMCRGAYAFAGEYQTCNVHLWRKSESMGVKHKIVSPEHTCCTMLPDVYRRAGGGGRACDRDGRWRDQIGMRHRQGRPDRARTGRIRGEGPGRDGHWHGESGGRVPPRGDQRSRKPTLRRVAGQCRPLHGHVHSASRHAGQHQRGGEDHTRPRGQTAQHTEDTARWQGHAPRRCCRPSMPPAAYSPGMWLQAAAAAGIWSRTAPKTGCPESRRPHRNRNSWTYCHPRMAGAVAARMPGGGGVVWKGGGRTVTI